MELFPPYSYNIEMLRENVTYWQCTIRPKVNPCKASVTQRNDTFEKNLCHNHQASTGSATVAKMISEVKKKAEQDLFKPPSVIDDEVRMIFKVQIVRKIQNLNYLITINLSLSLSLSFCVCVFI